MAILALVLSGCSSERQVLNKERARSTKSGAVSLVALARENPDWLLVANTDQAILRYRSILAMPALVQAQPGAPNSANGLLPAVPLEALPSVPNGQAAQELHLNRMAERQIARLTASLELAENERLDAERKLAQAQAERDYLSGRAQISDRFLTVERAIVNGDSDRMLNLMIQVKAMRMNAAGPRSAPDDYWGKIADAKEKELTGLRTGTAKQLALAQAASDAELASLQARLNAQAAAQVAAVEATIDRENDAVVQGQKSRLQKQRVQILAMTRALQTQVSESVAALKSTRTGRGEPETEGSGNWSGAVSATDRSVAASLPAWRNRLVATVAALQKQRDRQAALVTEETRRAVLQTAQVSRLRITNWVGEGADLTPIVLQSLRKERWGKA
jgi:hypothetical protein